MDSELAKPLELALKIMKKLGLMKDGQDPSIYFKVCFLLQFIACCIFFGGLFMALYKEAVGNLVTFIDVIGVLTAFSALVMKAVNFKLKIEKIKESIKTLELLLEFSADERWKYREKVKARVGFAYKAYKAFLFSAFLTCGLAFLVPVFTHELPYKLWFPFLDTTIGFWTASTYLTFYAFIAAAVDMTLDILPVIFISFAIGLIDELGDRLEEIGTTRNHVVIPETRHNEEFIKCVEIQMKIQKFVISIQDNFSLAIIFQGLMSSVILCSIAFVLTMVWLFFKCSIQK